jgi:hypothetical protein
MRKFEATFFWTMTHTCVIEAESTADAEEKATEIGFEIDVDTEGTYVDDSFELESLDPYDQQELTEIEPEACARSEPDISAPVPESTDTVIQSPEHGDGRQNLEKDTPLYLLKSGRVAAHIWDTETSSGEIRYSINLCHPYLDKTDIDAGSLLGPEDIPNALQLLSVAQNILREELGQDLSSKVKVTRNKDIPQSRKQKV